jgi:hypothetical protein
MFSKPFASRRCQVFAVAEGHGEQRDNGFNPTSCGMHEMFSGIEVPQAWETLTRQPTTGKVT